MTSENSSTLPVRLIGIGSALGADQIGWLTIHRLDAADFTARYPANIIDLDICLSPALLTSQCSSAQALILLDGYCANDPVGTVRHFSIEELDTVHRPASSHGFNLKQALALGLGLEKQPPPVSVIGICIGRKPDEVDSNAGHEILETAFQALEEIIGIEISKCMGKYVL